MTSILYDAVDVDVSIKDKIASAQSLDLAMVFDPDLTDTITNLTQSFVSDEDLLATFANTTKVYKCGHAHYTQPGHNSTFKVARASSGDANITASLDAIWGQDKDFFELMTTSKVEAEIDEISDWCLGKNLSFTSSIEIDSSMIDSGDETDLASILSAAGNSNTTIHAHHEAGVDVSGTAINVSSGVATVTQATHGLRVGDPVTVSGATPSGLNGNVVVATVPTSGTWTYTTTAADGAATGTIDYFARYTFIESGLQGFQLGKSIGSSSWAYKAIAGQTAIPKTIYSESNIQVLRDKHYITFTEAQNNISVTSDGFMVTGRQIVDEHVRVWLEINIAVNIFNVQLANEKIPYTNPGFELVRGAIAAALNVQLTRGGLNPYSDTQDFIITMPDALSASASNRQAGIMDTIEVTGRIGSAVLKIPVNVTLIV